MGFLTGAEREQLAAVVDHLVPAHGEHPGAAALGAVDYIDGLLAAFAVDPPRIFAGGPFSGRYGGDAGFARFTPLSPAQELAWRTRIEGSNGQPEREINGPVVGWQARYRAGLAALGDDFAAQPPEERQRRLDGDPVFAALVYEHTCEGCYGAPEYGGNRDTAGWRAIDFPGDTQPRGFTDDEVRGRA